MFRIAFLMVALTVVVSCADDRVPTAPTTTPAPTAIAASAIPSASPTGISTICLVNQQALASLDGQVQDNPNDEALKAEYDVQAAITADICD